MLTIFKEIFTWWNKQTLGTRIQTIFFGKLVGEDHFGNRYYENKSGKRWVIYNGEVEASNIPNEWYSWIHYTSNKIYVFYFFQELYFFLVASVFSFGLYA